MTGRHVHLIDCPAADAGTVVAELAGGAVRVAWADGTVSVSGVSELAWLD